MEILFTIHGIVQHGQKRGKELGFPTINIAIDQTFPAGTYISRAKVNDKTYNAFTFIGTVDTFDEKDYLSETHLFNYSKNVYGLKVTVEVLKKIRDNKKFESAEALIKQMEQDKKDAEDYFRT